VPTFQTFINRVEKYNTKLIKPKAYQVGHPIASQEFLSGGGQWYDICPTLLARDYKDPKVVVVYENNKDKKCD